MKILGLALLLGGLTLVAVGLWLLLSPAQYAATARIKMVEMDGQEADEYFQAHPEKRPTMVYDYYSYEPTIKKLSSQSFLTNVIERSKLDINWQKILRQMRIKPVRNTELISITFFSNDSKEAADLANAIAEAYRDYRIKSRREIDKKGLELLQQLYLDEEKQISIQPTNHEQLVENLKLLTAKIDAEKLNMQIPKISEVQIVDRAEPPQFPVGPNRTLGAVLFAAGLLSLLAGIFLLKPASQPAV